MSPRKKSRLGIEVWKDIPGYAGQYRVSNLGRVKSLTRTVRNNLGTRKAKGKLLKPIVGDSYGHLSVTLSSHSRLKRIYIHQLVLQAFDGPCPPGMESRHKVEPDPNNNALYNLEWGTTLQNARDRKRHGTASGAKGEAHRDAKLTEQDVLSIRRALKNPFYGQLSFLARKYGVDHSQISRIKAGEQWTHL